MHARNTSERDAAAERALFTRRRTGQLYRALGVAAAEPEIADGGVDALVLWLAPSRWPNLGHLLPNRTHAVEERCARWLLMTHDRVHEATFPLTEEFLAVMFGVRRPTVSIAAGMPMNAGLISYVRGQLKSSTVLV